MPNAPTGTLREHLDLLRRHAQEGEEARKPGTPRLREGCWALEEVVASALGLHAALRSRDEATRLAWARGEPYSAEAERGLNDLFGVWLEAVEILRPAIEHCRGEQGSVAGADELLDLCSSVRSTQDELAAER